MCARLLAGFLHSHFHDNLCAVLDEYVRAELSFANLGVREEARALVEQGGTVTRGGWRVQWQTYRQPRTAFTRGKGGSAQRSAPSTSAVPTPRGSGALVAPPAPALEPTSGSDARDRRRDGRPAPWRENVLPLLQGSAGLAGLAGRAGLGPGPRRPGGHGTWIPTMGISTCATL